MPRTAFATTLYDSNRQPTGDGADQPGASVRSVRGSAAPGPAFDPFPKDAKCQFHPTLDAELSYANCAGRRVFVCYPCFGNRVKNHAGCAQCWKPKQQKWVD